MDVIPLLYGASSLLIGAAVMPELMHSRREVKHQGLTPLGLAALFALSGAACFVSTLLSFDRELFYWPAAALCLSSAVTLVGVMAVTLQPAPARHMAVRQRMSRVTRSIPRIGGE